jgi:hypothetical protein
VLDIRELFEQLDEQGLLDAYVHTFAVRALADYESAHPSDLTPRTALSALAAYIASPTPVNAYAAHLAASAVSPSVTRADSNRRLTNDIADTAAWVTAQTCQRAALVPHAPDRVWAAILASESAAAAAQYYTWVKVGEPSADAAHRAECDWQLAHAIGLVYPDLAGTPAATAVKLSEEIDWTLPELIIMTRNLCL